ncbi:MAG: hypothetical protein ACREJC_12110, partial [Tepidisphaeraceae bacterium]
MRETPLYFDVAETADPAFDRWIEAVLIALLAIAPAAFGAVHPWSETIVLVLCAALAILLGVKLLVRPSVRFVWSLAYVPLATFLLLVVFQLVPIPAGVMRVISPGTSELKSRLLSDAPFPSSWQPISFYPEGTAHDLRVLLGVSAVFVVTVNCVRRQVQIRRLLGAIAV